MFLTDSGRALLTRCKLAGITFLAGLLFPIAGLAADKETRMYELRTYIAAPGKLDALHARVRDHTVQLLEKHGMSNIGYWVPLKDQKGADDTLIYVLAHQSEDAAKASIGAFRKDPAWTTALKASEQKAGGPLTVKDGVQSVFLKPTDYSPLK